MRSQLPRSTTSQPMSWPLHRSGSSTIGTIGSIAHQRTLGSCEPTMRPNPSTLRAVFVDANPTLGDIAQKLLGTIDVPFTINRQPDIRSEAIPVTLAGAEIVVIDHTQFPAAIARQCTGLKHVVFLGTGVRSYMSPEELGELGIAVHTIKGYGDTAVAECAVALMWTAARGFARMDREMRAGNWVLSDSLQLTGRTIGLLGFGGIATEVARLALGMGMKVLAWNRSPK